MEPTDRLPARPTRPAGHRTSGRDPVYAPGTPRPDPGSPPREPPTLELAGTHHRTAQGPATPLRHRGGGDGPQFASDRPTPSDPPTRRPLSGSGDRAPLGPPGGGQGRWPVEALGPRLQVAGG